MDKNKIIETAAKLIAKGAYDKAIREYQRILEVDSKDVRILQKLGELHQKRNDNVQAAQCFARVAESYTSEGFYLKAVALYKQVLRLDPNLVEINLTLAQLHQQLQLSGEAIAYLQVLLSHYEQLADLPKCVEILRRIVGLDPESVAFRTKLAGLYERSSDIVAAVSEFREVATVLRRLGRVDDFVRVAEHLSGLDPKDIQLARELATIYLGRGDHKRALAKLQLCFKADNRDVETLRILATTLEGLKQIPKTISVYKGLAHILEESGDVTEAMKVWKQVGRLDPQDPQYLEHKANSPDAADEVGSGEHTDGDATVRVGKLLSETVVYSKYGLFQKALEHLAKVFAIAPENIDAHERAYEIYVAQGDHERSFEQLLNVLRLHTRSGDRKRAQPFLETILRERPDHPEVVTFVAELGSAEEAFTGPTNDVKPPPPPLPGRAAPTQRTFVPPRAPGKSHLLTETTVPGLPTAKRTPSSPRAVPPPPPPRKTPSRPHAAMPLPPPPPRQTPSRPRTAIPLVPNPASHQATQAPPAGPALKLGRPGQPAAPHPVAPPQVTQIKAPPPPPKFAKPKDDVLPPPPRAPGGLPKSPSQIIAPPPNAPVRLEARPPPAPREQPLPLKPLADLPAPQFKKPERAPLPIDEEQLAEIDFFTEQGLHDEARSILQALLDKSPEHPQLLERLKALEPKQSEDPTPKIAAELDELSDEIGELEAIPAPSFQISAEEVISEFKKGISRVVKAKDVETHYDLGMAYKEMGLFDDALQEFSTARQQCIGKPKEINCLSMIGLVHSLKGDSAQAIAVYQEALALPGAAGHAECALRYELGKVLEASGAYGKALAQYLKAQAIDRGFREVSSDVERLSAEVSPEEDTPPARHPPRRADSK